MEQPEMSAGSKELQCVGKLEIVRPEPVGFLCGSIPVPTDKAFHDFDSALIPSARTVQAPRYQMIPTETDLNMLPLLSSIPDKVLPLASAQAKTNADLPWENGTIMSNLTRKGEALAVSGLVEYGDEIDVIAPTDILKQLFKMPYSKARLSIAVHRVGQTLVLNTGPDVEEGEKLVRRRKNQAKCADKSLFLNFAMHSVRMEACDCPPDHHATPKESSASCILPGQFGSREEPIEVSRNFMQGHASSGNCDQIEDKELNHHREYSKTKEEKSNFFWGKKKNKKSRGHSAVKKVSQVKENPKCSMQESDKFRRVNNDGFLRVLFWQFHNFRMLLGSDLLILSNEKYVAVSLHLWDVSRQVTPLTWLEAWLDNVMASVPELAICYHQDGVVQGYELLKTEDIFLLKGISEDGTPAFHPHVVQQNGLMVLRFLQDNCKQDPGAYWLHKSPGEDVIQLFDLSVMPKKHRTDDCDDTECVLPSPIHRGRSDSLLSLGTLLYRIAHRLSLSMTPDRRARCVRFFRQCLDFLDEPDHLVVRAFAHEQFARLLLTYDEEVDLTSEMVPMDSEVILTDAEEGSFEVLAGNSESTSCDVVQNDVLEFEMRKDDGTIEDSLKVTSDRNFSSGTVGVSSKLSMLDAVDVSSSSGRSFPICDSSESMGHVGQSISDPICSKLRAIHHVSQAIKSLRWKRKLENTESNQPMQNTESNWSHTSSIHDKLHSPLDFSICACGDVDCIEVCDIREWLPTSKLDDKSWKLVLLLGESYLALGQAYKDDGQLFQALKVVELACMVYGSVPQHHEDKRYISSIVCTSPAQVEGDDCSPVHQSLSTFLFWVKAWTLVGDVYVEFHLVKGIQNPMQSEKKSFTKEVKMSPQVLKEVERLRNKLGQFSQNCSSCFLMNCSCQSDRASSGNSASSSSSGNIHTVAYGRKQSKRSSTKGASYLHTRINKDDRAHQEEQNKFPSESRVLKHNRNETSDMPSMKIDAAMEKQCAASKSKGTHDINATMNDRGGPGTYQETIFKDKIQVRNGGIFKYVRNPVIGDGDYNLIVAINCYEEARKALGQSPSSSGEFQSVTRKKGWAYNELGRSRLERRDLDEAEVAFADAMNTFKEVSDYTNIVLINCNLGHGRRASAEEMVARLETLKEHAIFQNAYRNALDNAKMEYSESLRYYGAAKMELNSISEDTNSVSSSLRDEVCTQFAHTYLRLGMLLARENTVAEVYENGIMEDYTTSKASRSRREYRNHEISANEAIREALSIYESLGELRKQEAAYAYFQLACYQRDCCLKFLESDLKKNSLSKGENQRVKQYASLADRNWQKSMDFYGPGTHPGMYLTILIERAALSFNLSISPQLSTLESALLHLLEVRHLSENKSLYNDNPEACSKFWKELQALLKKMLSMAISATTSQKTVANSQQASMKKSGDVAKLRELYKISLNSTEFSQLHVMHMLWTS